MINIRRATAADRDLILALVPFLVAFGPPAWREACEMTRTDLHVIDRALQSQTEDPLVLVAELNGHIAAFIHLHSVEDYYRRKRHGHVADIVVAPYAQGRGISTTLLREAEQWAQRSGFDWLSISVFEQNGHAHAIYEASGFRKDIVRLVKPLGPPRNESATGEVPGQ